MDKYEPHANNGNKSQSFIKCYTNRIEHIENVGLTVTMTFTLNSDLIDIFKTADLIKSTIMMKVMLSTGSCNMDHAVSPIIKIHTWVQGCGVESWGSIIHFFCSIPLSLKAKYEF